MNILITRSLTLSCPRLRRPGKSCMGFLRTPFARPSVTVSSCDDCSRKVSKYRQLVHGFPNVVAREAAPPGADCPKDEDVDWHEVAAGLWPELKAKQLIMHAALCDHCGPLLRAATSVDAEPTSQRRKAAGGAESAVAARCQALHALWSAPRWQFMKWLVPAAALLVIVGVLSTIRSSSPASLSTRQYAEFAVRNHRQHAQGSLALDVRLGFAADAQ